MLGDLGGAASISMVRIGDSLGLYRALHSKGSMTCEELAQEASVHQRYLREWLSHQAASNYLSYDPATQKFALPPEQAMVFAIEDSPVYMMGAFDLMTWMTESKDQVQTVFRTGGGVQQHGRSLDCVAQPRAVEPVIRRAFRRIAKHQTCETPVALHRVQLARDRMPHVVE